MRAKYPVPAWLLLPPESRCLSVSVSLAPTGAPFPDKASKTGAIRHLRESTECHDHESRPLFFFATSTSATTCKFTHSCIFSLTPASRSVVGRGPQLRNCHGAVGFGRLMIETSSAPYCVHRPAQPSRRVVSAVFGPPPSSRRLFPGSDHIALRPIFYKKNLYFF